MNRWRLEKKDPGGQLSEPRQPIVFWVDRNVPVEYRDTVKAGILEWNKAFERIGFKNAIHVEIQPDDADTTRPTCATLPCAGTWTRATRARHRALAHRPAHRRDPRRRHRRLAGLDAPSAAPRGGAVPAPHAQALHPGRRQRRFAVHVRRAGDAGGDVRRGPAGKRAARSIPTAPRPEAIIKATLKDVITHEVGHIAGPSPQLPRLDRLTLEKELADPEFTRKNGISAPVWTTTTWNIALDKDKQGEYVMSTPGPVRLLGDRVRVQDAARGGGEAGPREDRGAQQRPEARLRHGRRDRRQHGPEREPSRPGLRPARLREEAHAALPRALGPLADAQASRRREPRGPLPQRGVGLHAVRARLAGRLQVRGGRRVRARLRGQRPAVVHARGSRAPARSAEDP